MPNEKRGPLPIAEALAGFLQGSGLGVRVKQSEVITRWAELVGPEVAAATKPLAVTKDGVLLVAVRSHPWMTELTMLERTMLAAINRATPDAPIREIRLQLAR